MKPLSSLRPIGWALLALASSSLVPVAALAADDGAWSYAGSPGWEGACAVHDPVRDRTVVFNAGGLGEVWAYSAATPQRSLLAGGGAGPGRMFGPGIAYDAGHDRLVVAYAYTGEAWALSLGSTPAWTQLAPAGGGPVAWRGQTVVHDVAHGRLVFFGGWTSVYDEEAGWVDVYGADVWTLSLGETPEWTQLAPAGTPPPARAYGAAVYDPAGGRMVLFGGRTAVDGATGSLADTWTLSLGDTPTWTELAPAGAAPPGRLGHTAVYDAARGEMVVFAGGSYTPPYYLDDAWTLSLGDTPAWTQLAPAGTAPGSRVWHAAACDPTGDRMLVFGGADFEEWKQVWSLSLGDDPAWTDLTPVRPPQRYGHTAVYDPLGDRLVLFGGYGSAGRLDDVWTLSLSGVEQWSSLAPAGTPPAARFRHSAVYDPPRGRMIVFGGYGGTDMGTTGPHFDDVWSLSLGATPAWTQLLPAGTPPAARQMHTAVYDPVGGRMIVHGGRSASTYYDDVWALSLGDTPTWTQLAPAGTSPGQRYGHTAVYDLAPPRMVVFGGAVRGVSSWTNDTWTLSLDATPTWTKLEPAGTLPLTRAGHVAVYDPGRDRMVVFSGLHQLGAPDYTDDPWALSLGETPTWTELSPAGEEDVLQEANAAAVYDPLRDRMLVTAGACLQCGNVYDHTYALTWSTPTVPVRLALVSAEVEAGRVRLTWYAAAGGGLAATVYRCADGEAWHALGTITADGTGQLAYEDRTARPGTRYGYRLGVMDGGVETLVGEAWVDVPAVPALALAGARPNPATGELAVAFTLPDDAPARLEAFDLAGRRVASREVGALGAGSHVVKLCEGAGLHSGAYAIRLVRDDRTLTTRAVIVK